MTVTVNGEPREVGDAATVAGVVAEVAGAARGVAVALNGGIVTRAAWLDTSLQEADQLEVLTANPGG